MEIERFGDSSAIRQPWINLYELYVGSFSKVDNDRAFRAFTGTSPEVAERIFRSYSHPKFLTRTKLFMVLNYLKDYPSEDNASRQFNFKTRTTYRKHVAETLEYLNYVMVEIDLESRFDDPSADNGIFRNISVVIDGTECPIDKPSYSKIYRKAYTSGIHLFFSLFPLILEVEKKILPRVDIT